MLGAYSFLSFGEENHLRLHPSEREQKSGLFSSLHLTPSKVETPRLPSGIYSPFLPFPQRGQKVTYGRSQEKPTVGRLDDPR